MKILKQAKAVSKEMTVATSTYKLGFGHVPVIWQNWINNIANMLSSGKLCLTCMMDLTQDFEHRIEIKGKVHYREPS